MKNETIKYSLVLLVITAVVALLLGFANYFTKDIIAEMSAKNETAARERVLIGVDYDEEIEVNDNLWKYVLGENGKEPEIVGYAVMASGNGYSGTIKLMVGLDKNLNVLGVDIIEHTETPGLGDKAQGVVSPQFVGKGGPFAVTKSVAAKDNEVQAISGATITTKAVVDIVNNAINLVASDR